VRERGTSRETSACDPLPDDLGLDTVALSRLRDYLGLVRRWRVSLDLVGRASERVLVEEHVRAALVATPSLPVAGRLLDIGSGVGLPAVPLLLARPALHGVLLEPRERRWAFLCEVVRSLDLDAEVVRDDARHHAGGPYDAVTVRGVDSGVWWDEVPRLVGPEGVLVWWTSEGKAEACGRRAREGRVVISALPSPSRGRVLVWRRCST
jgi:16S rRNA G527 N7-methylase RsmG